MEDGWLCFVGMKSWTTYRVVTAGLIVEFGFEFEFVVEIAEDICGGRQDTERRV